MTKTWMSRAFVPLAALVIIGAGVGTAEAATVTTTVAATLNVRTGPTTTSTIVGQIPNGGQVALACKVTGEKIYGRVRTTDQWDRTTDGRYVSHAYVRGATNLSTCPTPAGPDGSMTAAQFVAASVAPAQQGQREFRVPASVTIAQAILESGWGKSGLTSNDRNFFGIKCFNG
jgi:flagellum-specific peptidoglycan hydrolase FlgJ